MVRGLVSHWVQLEPQEVAFLPLKTADSLSGKGLCHLLGLSPGQVALTPGVGHVFRRDGQTQGEHPPHCPSWIPEGILL